MHTISVHSRQTSPEKLAKKYPGAEPVDVTSRAPEPWVRLSPFYPLGGVPVPFSPGVTSASVEGVWQGLKVFEAHDVDRDSFRNDRMRGLKRSVRRFGPCLGHRRGVDGDTLLGYLAARRLIYLPTYRWALTHRLADEVARLRALAQRQPLVLRDYATNCDVDDPRRPLSHAGLIRLWLLDDWPAEEAPTTLQPEPTTKPTRRAFSASDYERWADEQPPVSAEEMARQIKGIKSAPIIERAAYVRLDGSLTHLSFRLADSFKHKLSSLVANNAESSWLRQQYGAINLSTVIRDRLAHHLLCGWPLDQEPAGDGHAFELVVGAELLGLLKARLAEEEEEGALPEDVALGNLIERTLAAALARC